jgi:SAM-dependent methyltransferase
MTVSPDSRTDLYGASYRSFASSLYAEIRAEAFGEDIGQTGWITAGEQDLFIAWLALSEKDRLLDIACGSGRPTLRIAKKSGCQVTGIDLHAEGIAAARANAAAAGHAEATFLEADAARELPFENASFTAITCIDAINHLPDRRRVLAEWRRVLQPGGQLLFTDPIVLTGPITNAEVAVRASIGLFVFVPPGLNVALLGEAGFGVERVVDHTENMARNASGWLKARAKRESDLRRVEGDATFEGQQRFLETAATLAAERRLSRLAIVAKRR